WHKDPHARVDYLCGPTYPTSPSPCGSHSHTSATTWPCLMHSHAFVDHTTMSSYAAFHTGSHKPV
ncbi:hypothetical protein J1N35_046066, partial [Gossypium stocksii]